MITETIFISASKLADYEAALSMINRTGLASIKEVKRDRSLGDVCLTLEADRPRDFYYLGSHMQFFSEHQAARELEIKNLLKRG